MAFTPNCGAELWAALPVVVISSHNIPRWAVTISKSVGSGITTPASSGSQPLSSTNRLAPTLSVSSPATAEKIISPCNLTPESTICLIAVTAAAVPPFISTEPLPYILPSLSTAVKGGCSQVASPWPTTSRWQAKSSPALRPSDFMCATTFALVWSQLSILESIPERRNSAEITSAAVNSPFSSVVSA